jgi:hypothetical protein
MSKTLPTGSGTLAPAQVRHFEEVCDRFESAWKIAAQTGQRPGIEDHLGNTPEPERSVLLRELITLEIE